MTIVHQLISNQNTIKNLTALNKSWLGLRNNKTQNMLQTVSMNLRQYFVYAIHQRNRTKFRQTLRTINFRNQVLLILLVNFPCTQNSWNNHIKSPFRSSQKSLKNPRLTPSGPLLLKLLHSQIAHLTSSS